MMSTLVNAPGSPPGLSRSYTTSETSQLSRVSSLEGIVEVGMHFEEVDLNNDEGERARVVREQVVESEQGHKAARRPLSKRPALATLQTKQSSGYLRAIENGAMRSHTVAGAKQVHIEGEVSKDKTVIRLNSILPLTSSHSFARTPASSLAIPQSQQRSRRKTIRQLEAEYHDSDDELPDHASLFNVPVSPFLSAPRLSSYSGNSSPERASPVNRPGPHPLAHAQAIPSPTPKFGNMHSQVLPKRKNLPRSNTGVVKSGPNSPRDMLRLDRTRSWHTDLDREARSISEKLDYHAELLSRQPSLVTNNRASAPGAIPLPPIQRSELDFMPLSREKEAALSRTRPSWLPPKDPREEKKHLKEYQRMMRASLVADRKREEDIKKTSCADDNTRASLRRIWQYYIEPSTDISTIDTRVHGLCYRGVPSQLRGRVWSRAIGNRLNISEDDYTSCCLKVAAIKSATTEHRAEQDTRLRSSFDQINQDADTAFPDLNIFQKSGPQHDDLISVCEAYAVYAPDIGYDYGLHLIVALLLLQFPSPVEVFILLANILNCSLPYNFHSHNTKQTDRYFAKFGILLEQSSPRLYTYLFHPPDHNERPGLGFSPSGLLTPMLTTLFTNGLDLERLCRIWDIWVFEGDKYLLRAAVTVLLNLEQQIYSIEGDEDLRRRRVQEMLGWGPLGRDENGYWSIDHAGSVDKFVGEVRSCGTTPRSVSA